MLEVLYEDPKEDQQSDVMSIFSCGINDDESRKLIPNENENSSIAGMSKIFGKFGVGCSSYDEENDAQGQSPDVDANTNGKSSENVKLDAAWMKLDEEIRDVHHLIKEFSNIVVSVRFCSCLFL